VNGLRNIATPFAEDVRQTMIDLLIRDYGFDPDAAVLYTDRRLAVKRLMVTPEQVEEYVPASARARPTAKDRKAGWPWPYKVQAEALLPETRDQIVTATLDALLDGDIRESVIAREEELRREAVRLLAERFADGGEDQ